MGLIEVPIGSADADEIALVAIDAEQAMSKPRTACSSSIPTQLICTDA